MTNSNNQSFLVDKVGIFFTPEHVTAIINASKGKLVEIVGIDTLLTLYGNEYTGRCPRCGKTHYCHNDKWTNIERQPCFSASPELVTCKNCGLHADNPIDYLISLGKTLPETLLYLGVRCKLVDAPYRHQILLPY